ncbi:hypothetical protein AB1Y20_001394 [Prymnesium parvum]|uniref:Uncharacterized protein n=1 Tax=Prymnesium parvum TaxID=97485 RepID=A0AB34K7M7_PRYPA
MTDSSRRMAERLSPPAFAVTLLASAAILSLPCAHLIQTDWTRYAPPSPVQIWLTGAQEHSKVCWLLASGQPSHEHCMALGPTARRVPMTTYVGHCFGFLDAADAVVARACVQRGVSEYVAGREQENERSSPRWEGAQRWLADAAAASSRNRRDVYRGVQGMLLVYALLLGGGASHRRRPKKRTLTTHHVLLAFAVLSMLLDHFAKAVLRNGGSVWTFPAQFLGAPLFYYLAGANPLPDDRMSIIRLVLVHAIFLELSPLPGDITPYTLCTIAIIRIVMRFMPVPSHATMWMPLAHAAAAGALVAIEDLLGWSGLQLAYGARAFLWGATGFYQAHSDMLRDPAHCVAVPYLVSMHGSLHVARGSSNAT